MSNEAITWAFKQDIANSSAKFVLVVLADFADESWECFPGQKKIARMTGMGERSVRRSLEWLEEQGFITRCHRYGSSGKRTSDRYRLLQRPDSTTGQNDRLLEPLVSTTGQIDHRSDWPQVLPAKLAAGQNDHRLPPAVFTTGQIDHRSDLQSLPANLAGHEPLVEPPVISIEKARAAKHGDDTPIPPDFAVTQRMRDWATDNAPGVDVDFETEQFVDYWASRGTPRRDWTAAWRQWMRNQTKWTSQRTHNQPQRANRYQPWRNTDPARHYADPDPWA
ncbi:helix-turn-helix domain-containing protein [Nocardiopsis ansamitocini]|uniref:Helix-turn-helix domain-containing protein n=1 Tax=Nocardiopsis ansamitocini TaxID=1670832 RepID=A0A9W6P3E9_9ACTN|nr:helix-turn-helix domain-containing protein [Nocardiopsis ansamitocini]GLU46313.1 hypothetical protein Nans01_06640 [Nocardiopsis ansamitocini]